MSNSVISAIHLDFFYDRFQALKDVNVEIQERCVTALIGPSGCGKSTFIRIMNRMCDVVPGTKATGSIRILGQEIFDPRFEAANLRRQVGMVFQHPNPFPMSVYDNLVFGLRIGDPIAKTDLDQVVEMGLKAVDLWNDLKDRLQVSAVSLSADFQQRLCIARAIAIKPSILLMDEPCSSLDPLATRRVEELIFQLKKEYTIVIVTHSMQQAARVSDFTGFMLLGELIEFNRTEALFRVPGDKRTEDYISGKYG